MNLIQEIEPVGIGLCASADAAPCGPAIIATGLARHNEAHGGAPNVQEIDYSVVRRNDFSLVTPLTPMTPIWAILIGLTVLGEALNSRALTGAAITFAGLLVMVIPTQCRFRSIAHAAASRSDLPCT